MDIQKKKKRKTKVNKKKKSKDVKRKRQQGEKLGCMTEQRMTETWEGRVIKKSKGLREEGMERVK